MKKSFIWAFATAFAGGIALTSCSENDVPVIPVEPVGPEATVVDFEGEEPTIEPFVIYDEARISGEVVLDETEGTNVAKFTRSGSSGFGFVTYELPDMENATKAKISFDFMIPAEVLGQSAIAIGDAAVYNAATGGFNTSAGQYGNGTNGCIFYLGAYRGKAYGGGNENYFQINGAPAAASAEEHPASDIWGNWFHVDVDVNVVDKIVNYTVKNGDEVWFENNGDSLTFVSDAAETCTQLSIYIGYGGAIYYIDNISVTKEAYDANIKYADYTVTFVDTEGNPLPEDLATTITRRGKVGSAITLLDSDKANHQTADGSLKYNYQSDNSEGAVVTEEGTEIKVVYTIEEVKKYNYVINCMIDGVTGADGLLEQFRGEEFVGKKTTYLLPICYGKNGKYYTVAAKQYNGYDITLTGSEPTTPAGGVDYIIQTVTYSLDESIVYFADVEDLEIVGETINGFSFGTFNRISKGKSIRLTNGAYFTTAQEIPAGTYTISLYGRSDSGTSLPVSIYIVNADGSETKVDVASSPESFGSAGMGWFTFEGVTLSSAAKLKFVNETETTGFAYDCLKVVVPAPAAEE